VPRVKRLRALGVGVEELEHGARPVPSLPGVYISGGANFFS
jgi:hypothetical protein